MLHTHMQLLGQSNIRFCIVLQLVLLCLLLKQWEFFLCAKTYIEGILCIKKCVWKCCVNYYAYMCEQLC